MLLPSETKIVDDRISVKVEKEAPIARWSPESVYHTARACQAGIASLATTRVPDGLIPVFVAARCVPAESIYPPKSPAQKERRRRAREAAGGGAAGRALRAAGVLGSAVGGGGGDIGTA